ncbi:MAG: hypothetical protein KAT31_04765 [Bacteroidales bacterium]|nr:hypothetical protein [Bacteroidales bacterium]
MKKPIIIVSSVILMSIVQQLPAQEMKRLQIRYPHPMYVGTPKDLEVERLEKEYEMSIPYLLVPEGTVNVALDKLVECSDEYPIMGEPELITDGDKEATDGSYIELDVGPQYISIDLEETCTLFAIAFWHYHKKARVYYDLVVQVADDPDFIINVTTLYNNDHDNSLGLGVGEDLHYIESYQGRLIDARGVIGQYVRLYSNGNTDNNMNHYIEVEVHGKPVN